jgi:excisionase family DNA binding protein
MGFPMRITGHYGDQYARAYRQSTGGVAGARHVLKVRCGMGSNERPLSEVRFLTVAEVAAVMRVSKMTVYRLVHAGELPAVRVGRSFRVPEHAVHAYLRESYYSAG